MGFLLVFAAVALLALAGSKKNATAPGTPGTPGGTPGTPGGTPGTPGGATPGKPGGGAATPGKKPTGPVVINTSLTKPYTLPGGEMPNNVAERFGTTIDTLAALNPGLDWGMFTIPIYQTIAGRYSNSPEDSLNPVMFTLTRGINGAPHWPVYTDPTGANFTFSNGYDAPVVPSGGPIGRVFIDPSYNYRWVTRWGNGVVVQVPTVPDAVA